MNAPPRPAARSIRAAVEAAVVLMLAVALFREVAAEGYMISTGSMAPTLLGYHRRVPCEACGRSYAVGAAAEMGLTQTAAADAAEPPATRSCRCPNCGLREPDLARWPVNEGDQLLVHKTAFAVRHPRRWEVAVFRSPADPTQAFVKRVAGLPGEKIEVVRGDVFADGRLRRKPTAVQRSCGVTVYDDTLRPSDAAWRPRWLADPAVIDEATPAGGRFRFPAADDWQWVRYRHWLREGGTHRTTVPLAAPPSFDAAALSAGVVRYEPTGRLAARGVVPDAVRDRLIAAAFSPAVRDAAAALAERSHVSPITDACGYNAEPPATQYAVRDLMWTGRVTLADDASFRVRLLYGRQPMELVIDATTRAAVLATVGEAGVAVVLARGTLPRSFEPGQPGELMVSTFDRQVAAEFDGEPMFEPVAFEASPLSERRTRQPVRFAARGGRVDVEAVRLSRDVYVTPPDGGAITLGWGEYFMLGDNSPVSVDSRRWPSPAVPESALVGKPFLVHLPSRRATPAWSAGREVRTPDWGRVRLIR